MRYPPPEVLASWPAPNYENPVLRGDFLIPVSVILIVIATVMVCLRIYARFIRTRNGELDDWLVIVALPPAIALTVTVALLAEKHGFDRHIWDFDLGVNNINLVQQRKMEWTSSMLYLLSSNLTKLSLLWFYRRIFTTEPIRRILLCVTIFVIGYFVTFIGVLLFECRPLNFYWTSSATPTPNGTCADEASIHLVSGILNVIIDATILVLPLQAVFNLKINRRQKIQVASIFLAGILVVVSSTFRIVETAQTLRSYDVTWYGNLTWLWICIEVDVGLICASVPACRSLLSVWSEKLTTMQSLGSRNAPNSARDNASANTSTSRIQSRSSYAKMDTEKLGRKDNPANWNGAWKEEGMSKPSPVRLEKDEEHNLEFLGDPGGLAKELGKDKGDTASVRSMGVFYYH